MREPDSVSHDGVSFEACFLNGSSLTTPPFD